MKMDIKKQNIKNIVASDFFNLPEIKLSPDVKSRSDYEESDYLLAYLLSALRSFNSKIKEAREKLMVNRTLSFPKEPTIGVIYEILYKSGQQKYILLKKLATKISDSYQLSENWILSIEVVIVTNTFLVPKKIDPIRIQTPLDLTEIIDHIKNNSKSDLIDYFPGLLKSLKYPAIYFTSEVSINDIKNWINKNRELLRSLLETLPKRTIPKIHHKTILWGHIAWIYKRDGIQSWTEISDNIQKRIQSSEGPIFGETDAPSPNELKKYYDRFLASLKSLNK